MANKPISNVPWDEEKTIEQNAHDIGLTYKGAASRVHMLRLGFRKAGGWAPDVLKTRHKRIDYFRWDCAEEVL